MTARLGAQSVWSSRKTEAWIVPTIVQYELARCLAREVSEGAADDTIAFSTRCVVTPLDTRIAVQAAEIAKDHALAMADAIIYATALAVGADLLDMRRAFRQTAARRLSRQGREMTERARPFLIPTLAAPVPPPSEGAK